MAKITLKFIDDNHTQNAINLPAIAADCVYDMNNANIDTEISEEGIIAAIKNADDSILEIFEQENEKAEDLWNRLNEEERLGLLEYLNVEMLPPTPYISLSGKEFNTVDSINGSSFLCGFGCFVIPLLISILTPNEYGNEKTPDQQEFISYFMQEVKKLPVEQQNLSNVFVSNIGDPSKLNTIYADALKKSYIKLLNKKGNAATVISGPEYTASDEDMKNIAKFIGLRSLTQISKSVDGNVNKIHSDNIHLLNPGNQIDFAVINAGNAHWYTLPFFINNQTISYNLLNENDLIIQTITNNANVQIAQNIPIDNSDININIEAESFFVSFIKTITAPFKWLINTIGELIWGERFYHGFFHEINIQDKSWSGFSDEEIKQESQILQEELPHLQKLYKDLPIMYNKITYNLYGHELNKEKIKKFHEQVQQHIESGDLKTFKEIQHLANLNKKGLGL